MVAGQGKKINTSGKKSNRKMEITDTINIKPLENLKAKLTL